MTTHLEAKAETDGVHAATREFFHAWRRSDPVRIANLLAPDCEWYRDGRPVSLTDGGVFVERKDDAGAPSIVPEVVTIDDHGASALLFREWSGSSGGRQLVGFVNLKFDARGIATVSEAIALARSRRVAPTAGASIVRAIAKLCAIIGAFFVDELVFSLPVVAVAAIWGPSTAFVLLTPIYFGIALVIGLAVSRIGRRRGTTHVSSLQRWLDSKTARRRTAWARRSLAGFGLLGAGVVTVALGPILTPWLTQRLGLDHRHGSLIAGSGIWAICLVATYSGLIALIL